MLVLYIWRLYTTTLLLLYTTMLQVRVVALQHTLRLQHTPGARVPKWRMLTYADVRRCVSQWHALVQACRVLAEALPGLCRLHALDSDALLPDEVRRMLTHADVC
jgi:hypothetical protein